VPLNAQELRNGRYFGKFKQTAYTLAHEHLEFWRIHRVFTERNIARMLEVELTSELMIGQLDGMQDKKGTIEHFYFKFDDHFPKRKSIKEAFRATIDEAAESLGDDLRHTEFRRPPLFYTLFCAICHRIAGLPGADADSPHRRLQKSERLALREAVLDLSEKVSQARDSERIPESYGPFVAACLSQTDNIKPRQTRFRYLYKRAFL